MTATTTTQTPKISRELMDRVVEKLLGVAGEQAGPGIENMSSQPVTPQLVDETISKLLAAYRPSAEVAAAQAPASTIEQAAAISRQIEKQSDYSKVGIAQITVRAARLEDNFQSITRFVDKAKEQNLDLLVFPELTIPGYLALDNFENDTFIEANLEVLQRVVDYSKGCQTKVLVGFVDKEWDEKLARFLHYNSAALIQDGKVLEVFDKTLLPTYDIFDEDRYYSSARARRCFESLGVEICEDGWDGGYAIKVTDELCAQGARTIASLNASPFDVGKYRRRFDLVSGAAANHQVPFLYANMVGTQDGFEGEVVFDGRSMIVSPDGKLLGLGKAFEEELIVVDMHQQKEIPLPEWTPAEEVHDALVLGIRDYFKRNGFERAYIGISGGIDSAVTAGLAVEALGAENVIGITMPSHITGSDTFNDAVALAENLGIRLDVRPIADQYRAWEEQASKTHGELKSITKQNYQARLRGAILMEYTNEDRQGLVISTGNKTELALGYCTLYGDMCGGLAALGDVSKLMVYEVGREVNRRASRELIPESTFVREPSAELEPGQRDKDNLPADYDVLSPLVDHLIERDLSKESLFAMYGETVVRKTARLIRINEFKRRQAAPAIRVTCKAFGFGRRFPIDNHFCELAFNFLDGAMRKLRFADRAGSK